MAHVKIIVVGGLNREVLVIDVPEWDDLDDEDQNRIVQEAAAPAKDRMDPTVRYYEV